MSAQKITLYKTRWPKYKELKELGSNALHFFRKGYRDATICTRKRKSSRLIWVPLSILATKEETSKPAQRRGWSGEKGSSGPWQDVNLPLFEDALGEKALTVLLGALQRGLEKGNPPNP